MKRNIFLQIATCVLAVAGCSYSGARDDFNDARQARHDAMYDGIRRNAQMREMFQQMRESTKFEPRIYNQQRFVPQPRFEQPRYQPMR